MKIYDRLLTFVSANPARLAGDLKIGRWEVEFREGLFHVVCAGDSGWDDFFLPPFPDNWPAGMPRAMVEHIAKSWSAHLAATKPKPDPKSTAAERKRVEENWRRFVESRAYTPAPFGGRKKPC